VTRMHRRYVDCMRREGNEAAWFTGYSATLKRNVGRKHVGRGIPDYHFIVLDHVTFPVAYHWRTISPTSVISSTSPSTMVTSRLPPGRCRTPCSGLSDLWMQTVRRTGRCRRASRCNSACRRPYCRRGREQHHARFAPRKIAARDPDRRQVFGRACVHCHRSAIASLAFLIIPEGVRTIPAT
jgi:hypothetical protein